VSARAGAAPPLPETRLGPARVWCSGAAHGNVGDHVGDDPAVVARNRAALASSINGAIAGATGAAEPRPWVWIRQVHGAGVYVATGPGPDPAPEADAVVTAARGLALAVVTADCAPLVLASDDAVGVVHAGYRGLALGVIEAALTRLRDIGQGEVRAFLGPCIRAPRYEFGADDLARLVAQFGASVEGRTHDGRLALDIPAAIAVVLEREGVTAFADSGVCTSESDGYFSFRRDGETGRQATIVIRP
jgi:polyphenol oxidase